MSRRARDLPPSPVETPDGSLVERLDFAEAADGQRLALIEVFDPLESSPHPDAAFLLLHGFAQNRTGYTLGPMPRELLARGARVFIGELRGHGRSIPADGERWTLDTHLRLDCPALLEGVRKQADVERVHLIGHSMGGLLGCALLALEAPLASLTAVATPLLLGAGRPLVRLASLLGAPLAALAPRGHHVRVDWLLASLAGPLSRADAAGPLRAFQRLTRLANPHAAPPEALHAILSDADRESPAVFHEIARNALRARPRLAGVDLIDAVARAPQRIAAVVGSDDIFAPRAAVAPLESVDQAGPRHVIEIPGGTHVDAIMGHHVPATVAALWAFLFEPTLPAPEPPARG